MIYSKKMKYPKYYWLNENSRTFLSRGYISESPEQRIKDIANTAEKNLKIDGFAQKFEDYMARGFYSLSTPVWINYGKEKGLPISCYGSNVDDNMDSILNAGREIGMMSKYGGGTSAYLGNIRPRGSVISTGGLKIKEIDNLVSFFNHKGNDFALMHCVSVYPSEDNELSLNQIDLFKNRYSKIPIGWSTHEHPYNTTAVAIAKSKGASLFERHVGLNTEEISLNLYSSTPEQAGEWIDSYISASKMCGDGLNRTHPENEQHSLEILKRGVYLKDDIEMGEYLTKDKVFFAMPLQENQLDSGTWNEKIEVRKSLKINDPILKNSIKIPDNNKGHKILKEAIHEIKALLNEASIVLNSEFDIEFSHHYGKEKFFKVGTFIVNCINRDYCKKILVQLPGQKHPVHYHLKKEETFQVLYGCLETITEGQRRTLHPGQTLLIQPGVWHSFWSDQGCVFEEVSTTHFNNDSIYNDKKINDMKREDRKTTATNWGRFTIND